MSPVFELVSFTDIEDFSAIAADFSAGLRLPANADIAADFPSTVERYGNEDVIAVRHELEVTAEQCSRDKKRQQFIAYYGERVVGLSMIQSLGVAPPDGIPRKWPILTSFIMHPYRQLGFGLCGLRTRLAYVDRDFNGHAWTRVRNDNHASLAMVRKAGLQVSSKDEDHTYFTYSKRAIAEVNN